MKPVTEFLRRTSGRHWAWIHAFLALGLGWGTAIMFQPPPNYKGVVDSLSIYLLGLTTAMGGVLAVIGMLMTIAKSRKVGMTGLWLELVGSILLFGGPFQYLGLQIGFLINGQWDSRYALSWFAYSMLSFVVVRLVIIVPALVKQARLNRRSGRHV